MIVEAIYSNIKKAMTWLDEKEKQIKEIGLDYNRTENVGAIYILESGYKGEYYKIIEKELE